MTLQERMIEYRAKNNLSTMKASKQAGVSDQTWRFVEKGLQDCTPVTKAKIELAIGKEEQNESINKPD